MNELHPFQSIPKDMEWRFVRLVEQVLALADQRLVSTKFQVDLGMAINAATNIKIDLLRRQIP